MAEFFLAKSLCVSPELQRILKSVLHEVVKQVRSRGMRVFL